MKTAAILLLAVLSITCINAQDDAGGVFASMAHGFSITPPEPAANKAGAGKVVHFFLPPANGFAGNVNIIKQPYRGTIAQYDKISSAQFKKAGLTIVTHKVMQNEVVYEYKGKMQGRNLHWYARAIKVGNYVCLITATDLQANWTTTGATLTNSVKSFKLAGK